MARWAITGSAPAATARSRTIPINSCRRDGWSLSRVTAAEGINSGSACRAAATITAGNARSSARGEKGVLAVELPLPPGCMSTVWRNDDLFEKHYCGQFSERPAPGPQNGRQTSTPITGLTSLKDIQYAADDVPPGKGR